MSFFDGFADELLKMAQDDDILGSSLIKTPSKKSLQAQARPKKFVQKKSPSLAFGQKKTFVPGMSQKQVKEWDKKSRMPAPKVQRFNFKNP